MPGLIDSDPGLNYGSGLIFETGVGGPGGLINPSISKELNERLAGAGSLSASARLALAALLAIGGSGSLSIVLSGRYVTNPAKLGGSGSLSAVTS